MDQKTTAPADVDALLEKIELIFLNFDLKDAQRDERKDLKPITLWLPVEYTDCYAELQLKTRQKFGKRLKEVVMHSIDIVMKKAS